MLAQAKRAASGRVSPDRNHEEHAVVLPFVLFVRCVAAWLRPLLKGLQRLFGVGAAVVGGFLEGLPGLVDLSGIL